ncbi:MAG: hypothetical protein ACFFD4_18415 [Candidatus Odinarchaeota archaeon]
MKKVSTGYSIPEKIGILLGSSALTPGLLFTLSSLMIEEIGNQVVLSIVASKLDTLILGNVLLFSGIVLLIYSTDIAGKLAGRMLSFSSKSDDVISNHLE